MAEALHKGEKAFRGIGVSGGVCRGKILIVGRTGPSIDKRPLSDGEVAE